MNIEFFKELTEVYFENCNRTEEAYKSFVNVTLSHYRSDEDYTNFAFVVEELINHLKYFDCEDVVFSYLIDAFDGTGEFGLAEIIARLSFDFTEEIINFAIEKAHNSNEGYDVDFNELLLCFINENDRTNVTDFEHKVKTILSYMNEAAKQKDAAIRQKEIEIRELRLTLSDCISAEQVLAAIKEPLTELEQHIASKIRSSSKPNNRLIEIASDLRKKIEELYGIQSLESFENWRNQLPVVYDPNKHLLIDKTKSVSSELRVCVESRGFVLSVEGESQRIVKAVVSPKSRSKTTVNSKRGANDQVAQSN